MLWLCSFLSSRSSIPLSIFLSLSLSLFPSLTLSFHPLLSLSIPHSLFLSLTLSFCPPLFPSLSLSLSVWCWFLEAWSVGLCECPQVVAVQYCCEFILFFLSLHSIHSNSTLGLHVLLFVVLFCFVSSLSLPLSLPLSFLFSSLPLFTLSLLLFLPPVSFCDWIYFEADRYLFLRVCLPMYQMKCLGLGSIIFI